MSVPYGTGTMTQLVPHVVQGVEGQGGGLFIYCPPGLDRKITKNEQ